MHFKHLTSLFQSKVIRSSGGVVDTQNSTYQADFKGDHVIDPTFGLSTIVPTESGFNQTVRKYTAAIDSFAGLSTPGQSQWPDTLPISGGGISQSFGDNITDTTTLTGTSSGGWIGNTSDQGLSTVPATESQTPLPDNFNTPIEHDPYRTHSTGGVVVENPNTGEQIAPSSSNFLFEKKGENFIHTGITSKESSGNVSNMSSIDTININNITIQTGHDTLAEFDFQHVRERSRLFGSPFRTMPVDIGKEIRKFGQTAGGSGGVVHQVSPENTIDTTALSDGNYLTSNDINLILQSMNGYAVSHDISITSMESVKANQDLMTIVTGGWHQ
ncbi:MAG: hypothetical protein M0P91_05100 [Sulfuricurvum sp.]|jgi:hypothetical protein|uniref:hypothetical protein n=1 Tax=Sulfuricurvum sp. TaxID=2025608 RepID=UPI0025EF4073|nr:hypothetical protein [Sulfuricurvum sp.]MCK9372553.1 hypothetical protein [Sulfuricurvum sp.]